jgi:hypothetical protein
VDAPAGGLEGRPCADGDNFGGPASGGREVEPRGRRVGALEEDVRGRVEGLKWTATDRER